MEYAAWAVYCYIAIQLINDRRKQAKVICPLSSRQVKYLK